MYGPDGRQSDTVWGPSSSLNIGLQQYGHESRRTFLLRDAVPALYLDVLCNFVGYYVHSVRMSATQ